MEESRIHFEPTLARGLDYYTGIIIEVEVADYQAGSVGGGGRYNNLIGMFANRSIPAVGFAFGFDRIIEGMDEQHLFPEHLTTTQVLVTVFSEDLLSKSIEMTYRLRAGGINTEVYLDPSAKMEKQLKYADQKHIPYAVIIGPEEAEKQKIQIKNLITREQNETTIDEFLTSLSAS